MEQMEFFHGRDTLKEERERLLREREKGTHCAACGQFVKLYHRQIHSTMAHALIQCYLMMKGDTAEWFHVTQMMKRPGCSNANGDFQKLCIWGLMEEHPVEEKPENGAKSSGLWRLTVQGCEFSRRKLKVPKYAHIYNDTLLGFSDEMTDIVSCLKKRFNYEELMGGLDL